MKNCLLILFLIFPFLVSAQLVDSVAVRTVDSLIQVSRTLTGQRDFDKALEVNGSAELLAIEKLGKGTATYGICCNNHGRVLYFKSDFQEAEKWFLEAVTVLKNTLGEEHPIYASSLLNLGSLYFTVGNYEKTEPLYLEAKAIRAKAFGKEHPDYAICLNNLAALYFEMGKYEKVEPIYLETLNIQAKAFGRKHLDYARSLNNLAALYDKMGTYEKAEPLYLEALNIREESLGKEHPDYASVLYNLATMYYNMSNYEKAEPLYLEAKAIQAKTLGKEHSDYASSLNGLANIYTDKGEYENAEPVFIEIKDIYAKTLGKENPDYALSLSNLAGLYFEMGNYENAEALYLEAKAIQAKMLGVEHPDYATSLNNLASLYHNMGNYEKAEPLYTEALLIKEKALGKEHRDYALSLYNLASLYASVGNYEKAELLFIDTKIIQEKVLGKNHPQYAETLNGFAALYFEMEKYNKSELFFLEAKAIWEKALGKEHPNYASSLNGLANIYIKSSNYKMAEPIFVEIKDIYAKALGKGHPDYVMSLENLASIYSETGDFIKAELLISEFSELNQILITKAMHHLSEQELNSYLKKFTEGQDKTLSFAQLSSSQNILTSCYDNSLFYKGFLLNATTEAKRLAHTDSVSTEKFNKLKGYRRRLATQEALPFVERDSIAVADLESHANDLEKDIARTVAGYGEAMRQVAWNEVQVALKPNEAAIEFVRYRYWNNEKTDSVLYAALLLRPKDKTPHYVYLCTEAQLKNVLDRWDDSNVEISPAEVYWQKQGELSLYELLWQPLEALLPKGTTVWYAPDGQLHRLNLSAISRGQGHSLAGDYSLRRIGSTRQLVLKDAVMPTGLEAELFGGLQYESDTVAMKKSLPDREIASLRDGSIDYLDNSLTEVQGIAKSLKTAGFAPRTLSGFGGTEEVFLSLGGSKKNPSPRILHMATHGYFFPDPKEDNSHTGLSDMERNIPYRASDNPLIRSGLLLSGCEQAWRTGKPASDKLADGILTAADIASMDLSNTELAVLSACQTGLGDVESNEGVYGLQRAFKIAGAHYLIMSLWKVDDRATMKLMTSFYSKWLDKKKPLSIPEAFNAAQKELRQEFPDPFFWAGFVLVE